MPVVYTPNGGSELVIIGSIQNVVRVIDSATGHVVAQKVLDAPYVSSDSNCNDGATVGITGTPVIDPATE
jgi:iron transport multicopper oxidase